MESPIHTFTALFDQLGLPSDAESINRFIENNKSIPEDVELHEANIWTASQAMFIKEMKDEDADWSELIDQLDVMLR